VAFAATIRELMGFRLFRCLGCKLWHIQSHPGALFCSTICAALYETQRHREMQQPVITLDWEWL
jgi:hypothetical protein